MKFKVRQYKTTITFAQNNDLMYKFTFAKYFSFLVLSLISFNVFCQVQDSRISDQTTGCGFNILLVENLKQDFIKQKYRNFEDAIYRKNGVERMSGIYNVPVVFHIIYDSGQSNISDQQVSDGLQWLNDAFSNNGQYNSALGVDCEISFCLAQKDEFDNATTGILRISSPLSKMTMETDDQNLKSLGNWNTEEYLNVYIVDQINSQSIPNGIAGYASFPNLHGQLSDGVVIDHRYLGTSNNAVFAHEVGHYLGLYHTFEGGCFNDDCQLQGDKVCDTPPDQVTSDIPCNATINSCSTDEKDQSNNNPFRSPLLGGLGDQNDMTHNYMDYGNISCFNRFTEGQKTRMRMSLAIDRAKLKDSDGCLKPCASPVVANFTIPNSPVDVNTPITFLNASSGTGLAYEWKINDVVVSTAPNLNYLFSSIGSYIVSLTVSNSPDCIDHKIDTLDVKCNTRASYNINATQINPGESINCQATSIGAISYAWYLNGSLISNNIGFSQTFSNLGGYSLQLIVNNGTCNDTSLLQYIYVGNPSINETANWYFGNGAGIKFTSNGPVVDLNNKFSNTQEGTACMSDENGNLLFYTDGSLVYDGSHQLMPNGSGLLGGIGSSTQAALILKKPSTSDIYYIFTVDQEAGPNGFRYSLVDMKLNNGRGDIIEKNNLIQGNVAEKLSATRHCNGKDIWVTVHGFLNRNFYTYLLTENGLEPVPVTSTIGANYPFSNPDNHPFSRGYLRFNHQGNKAVTCIGIREFELYDFDNRTGIFSNLIASPSDLFLCYGAEFSPDDTKLYIGAGNSNDIKRHLYQYNMLAGSPSAILNSKYKVGDVENIFGIALAPDGKIYVSSIGTGNQKYLHSVDNPNELGAACNYKLNSFYLGNKNANSGLPNFMSNYFYNPPWHLEGNDKACVGQQYEYKIKKPKTYPISFDWSADPNVEIDLVNDTIAIIHFLTEGVHNVIINKVTDCQYEADTITVEVGNLSLNLGPDTVVCNNQEILLVPEKEYASYLWNNNSIQSSLSTKDEGEYWLEVEDSMGCKSRDTISIKKINPISLNLGPDILNCLDSVMILTINPKFKSIEWEDRSQMASHTIFQSGKYWVSAIDECGLLQSDTLNIIGQKKVNLGDIQSCGTYMLNDSIYENSGQYTQYLVSSFGCDSILEFNLKIDNFNEENQHIEVCDSIVLDQQIIKQSGLYDIVFNTIGCDSIVHYDITIHNSSNSNLQFRQCEPLEINGQLYSQSGSYIQHMASAYGCDSTLNIELLVFENAKSKIDTTITCKQEEIISDTTNIKYYLSDCDSLIIIHQKIYEPNVKIDSIIKTCDTMKIGIDTMVHIGLQGQCDSLFLISYVYENNLKIDIHVKDESCFENNDGELSISNAMSSVSLSIDNGLTFTNDSIISSLSPGTYSFVAINDDLCKLTKEIEIKEATQPYLYIGNDTIIEKGDNLPLIPSTNIKPPYTISWTPYNYLTCDTCLNTITSPMEKIKYKLAIKYGDGCTERDEIEIEVLTKSEQLIPNIFSPNGDGIDDFFPNESNDNMTEISIYSRWGELIYRSISNGWDGTCNGQNVNQGVYVYLIKYLQEGTTKQVIGDVTLIK